MVRKTHFTLVMLLAVTACTSPLKEGLQPRLKASLPVTAEVIFE